MLWWQWSGKKKIKNKVSRWLVSFAWFAGGRVGLGGAMQNEKKKERWRRENGEWRRLGGLMKERV